MKTRNGVYILGALLILAAVTASPVRGQLDANIYPRTDRPSYLPGDSGTLLITIRNDGDQAFTLRSMDIEFPWMAFISGRWDGNQTLSNINQAIPSGGGYYDVTAGFVVPSDGRVGLFGSGRITIHTDATPSIAREDFLVMVAVPAYQTGAVGSVLPYLEILLQAAMVFLLLIVFFRLRRVPK